MVKEKDIDKGFKSSIQTSTSTHTQNTEGEVAESAMSDRICPLLQMMDLNNIHELQTCLLNRCAWFDFHNDACALLAISRMLNSFEEWERDRT